MFGFVDLADDVRFVLVTLGLFLFAGHGIPFSKRLASPDSPPGALLHACGGDLFVTALSAAGYSGHCELPG